MGNSNKISIGGIIGSVIFFLSFLPYVHLIYIGLTGVLFGMQGFVVCYGYMGMFADAIFLTFFLVLPICIIYQIAFGINCIRHHKKLSKATLLLFIILIIAGLITEPVANCIHGTTITDDPVKIEEFNSQKHWPW
jgi:hypothetical protein